MRELRKLMLIILSAVLLLSMTACGGTHNATDPTPMTPTSEQNGSTEPTTPTETDAESLTTSEKSEVLVVYYSATGTTGAVSQTIADHMKADIFELIPTQPYTEGDLDWRDESSRVNAEHNDESKRDIELESITPDNWDDYDTVFVGYPIWWGIAAWPVNSFVKGNDFTGKTVIPFCTSASSGLGQSGELLAEMAGTGDWQQGIRFSGGADAADVIDWVKSLKLTAAAS